MVDITALKKANLQRWQQMQVTQSLIPSIDKVSARLVAAAAKTRYQAVSAKTGVPWHVIAVIHEREASQSFKANLAQGDPFDKVSVHVPKGRGPFDSWEDAAIDALTNCDPRAALWKDWSIGGSLTLLEEYNGLGYAARNKPSPYVWASTNQYVKGKFVADGHYDPNAVDHQMGCAALLSRMRQIDSSINLGAGS
jgi:lysozyme family protein